MSGLFSPPSGSKSFEERPNESQKVLFQKLKPVCVALLGNSRLTHQSTPKVLGFLGQFISLLDGAATDGVNLSESLNSYVFFPLSNILQRNPPASIPDQILEKVLISLKLIFNGWWWTCDAAMWEQVVILAASIIDEEGAAAKQKERDEETRTAAVFLLQAVLRMQSDEDGLNVKESIRIHEIVSFARDPKIVPIIGRTLNAVLTLSLSTNIRLQIASLQLTRSMVALYLPESVIPSVLPGVVSKMARIALGQVEAKARSLVNGAVAAAAIEVLTPAIVRGIGDEVCIAEGVVKEVTELEDLVDLTSQTDDQHTRGAGTPAYLARRTPSWLRGTTSQLHIALNTLSPLVSHTSSKALLALSTLCRDVLTSTRLTLPQSQPLLLTYLLSLSIADYATVSEHAVGCLRGALSAPNGAAPVLLDTLFQITSDNLSSLPRLLLSRSDARIEHTARLIEAVCLLASPGRTVDKTYALSSPIKSAVGHLLGPFGQVEKWGWSLLSVLDLRIPALSETRSTDPRFFLESDLDAADLVVFPSAQLLNISLSTTRDTLTRTLRALGRTGGEDCLFSVEWFIDVGRQKGDQRAPAALWCAAIILEGIADVNLDDTSYQPPIGQGNRRLQKFARLLARSMAEMWDRSAEDDEDTQFENRNAAAPDGHDEKAVISTVEFVKGLEPVKTRFDNMTAPESRKEDRAEQLAILQKTFALRLISISSAVLRSHFSALFLHILYPVLHSLVSESSFLASTAFATFQYLASQTGFARPGNLLLTNFDYALDSVSRRLSRRWLDVDAPKVLVILVRIVGKDIVQRAGDVVEECFDRLDDFHGYEKIVEGLVDALHEVVKVLEFEERPDRGNQYQPPVDDLIAAPDDQRIDSFVSWYQHRNDPPEEDNEDYGPHPKEAWVPGKGKQKEGDCDDDECDRDHQQDGRADTAPESTLADPPPTPIQALTAQIISRSLYFLTHGSPMIRARILTLLSTSVPILPEFALMPAIHRAWPFILNRMSDLQTYVVSAAAQLVAELAIHAGAFMSTRVWDDVWPRFQKILKELEAADKTSALARRGVGAVGTQSTFTHSHRLYRAMMRTMQASIKGVQVQDSKVWDVIMAFRRFLSRQAHPELQECAKELYRELAANNADAVWLVLQSTVTKPGGNPKYLDFVHGRHCDIPDNITDWV